MSLKPEENGGLAEKHTSAAPAYEPTHDGHHYVTDPETGVVASTSINVLHRDLKGRHMQMIAIGGAIGAGLFVNSGSAFQTGGPGSVLLGFMIIGGMIYLVMQALAEMAVLYPINGAFTMYIVRFVDPSWGFACGWQYAISWLTVLPFEISAACNIIHYWPGSDGVNDSAWIVPLLTALIVIQVFGVRGYGEVEFALSLMKIIACLGFMLLAIIIDCGGVPTDPRGYIGAQYWHAPEAAFRSGFHGFCTVFVTASFAYTGTELTGLAAAETADPVKEIPRASKQVVWRLAIFYIINLFLVGLIVPSDSDLYSGGGSESRHSPFVIAIALAKIPVLPSIFNAMILISVMSVANSCTFGSTRTMQALAANGMGPQFMAYIDKRGRPIAVIVCQLLFGCLAFINLAPSGGDIFTWLLSLSGLSILFIYGSIALAHIRFRKAWAVNGHSTDELPFRAAFGVWGSWLCLLINVLALIAQFYVALYPVGGPYLDPTTFFEDYLAGPFLLALYFIWKVYSWFVRPSDRPLFVRTRDMDIYAGMRETQLAISGPDVPEEQRLAAITRLKGERKAGSMRNYVVRVVRNVI